MKIIKLTTLDANYPTTIYIRADRVVALYSIPDYAGKCSGTSLITIGESFLVREMPLEILSILGWEL